MNFAMFRCCELISTKCCLFFFNEELCECFF